MHLLRYCKHKQVTYNYSFWNVISSFIKQLRYFYTLFIKLHNLLSCYLIFCTQKKSFLVWMLGILVYSHFIVYSADYTLTLGRYLSSAVGSLCKLFTLSPSNYNFFKAYYRTTDPHRNIFSNMIDQYTLAHINHETMRIVLNIISKKMIAVNNIFKLFPSLPLDN